MRAASLVLPSLLVLTFAGPARAQAPDRPEEPPSAPPQAPAQAPPARSPAPALGLGLENARGGARILTLDLGNPSASLLEPNDIVVAVDTRPIRDAAELREYLAGLPQGAPALFEVRRRGQTRYVGVQLTEAPPPPACPAPPGATGAPLPAPR